MISLHTQFPSVQDAVEILLSDFRASSRSRAKTQAISHSAVTTALASAKPYLEAMKAAVVNRPIFSNRAIDLAYLLATGVAESRFKDSKIQSAPDTKGRTAKGFFQLRPIAIEEARRAGVKFDWPVKTQAEAAAVVARSMSRYASDRVGRSGANGFRRIVISGEPVLSAIASTRLAYGGGPTVKAWSEPDAVIGLINFLLAWDDSLSLALAVTPPPIASIMDAPAAIAVGDAEGEIDPKEDACGDRPSHYQFDPSTYVTEGGLTFVAPHLIKEYSVLPGPVKSQVEDLLKYFGDDVLMVTSIRSSYTGDLRTSPNHGVHKAIDLVIKSDKTSSPFTFNSEGHVITPRYWANPHLIAAMKHMNATTPFTASTVLETDHIHIDSNHPAGLYLYPTYRKSCSNDALPADVKWGDYLPTKIIRLI